MPDPLLPHQPDLPFLRGGGEMGELIRTLPWASTSLGEPALWPAALKQMVSMMLNNKLPVLICWGKEHTQLYNDAFRPINGADKHPKALGGSARDTYAEIWDTIGPMFEGVMEGQSFGFPDFKVRLERNGHPEDCYFDFSYSPINTEDGSVAGVLVICIETTDKVRMLKRSSVNQQNIRNMVLQAPVGMCIVKGEPLMVEEVNDFFLELVGKPREAFKNTPYWVVNAEAAPYYEHITDNVLRTGETYHANEHEIMLIRNGIPEIVHVDFVYEPIKDVEGTIEAIMIVAIDVTHKVLVRKKIEESETELQFINEELATTNEELLTTNDELMESQQHVQQTLAELAKSENRLSSIVASAPFPIGVYTGREMRILMANKSIIDAWGKGDDVVGRLYSDLLPELATSGIYQQLDNVYTTGIAYHTRNQRVDIMTEGALKTYYFNYSFTPLHNAEGLVYGVMNTAADVTDLAVAKQRVEQSEENLYNMILQAPVAICILLGPSHVIEVANKAMIELWGKPEASVMKKPVFDALPDAREQGLEQIMHNVYNNGETFEANEMPISLVRNGVQELVYQSFVYQPYNDLDGKIIGIMAISIDVTEQFIARKKIERAEEMLRMATDSAELGTWYLHTETNKFTPSPRFKKIFGFNENEPLTYDQALAQISPDDQQTVNRAVDASIKKNAPFDVDYSLTTHNNGKQRWVKSVGKFITDANEGNYLTGVLIDITEQKQDDLRKNDFIGMVSHELKTPLTSLSAIIQVLNAKLKANGDVFVPVALDKAEMQVKKMGSMINGFLNISRLESGKISIDKYRFKLDELLHEIIEETKITVTTHTINMSVCDEIEVYADREKIGSVISNLVSNAVKYSPKGKNIDITCKTQNNLVTVGIKDEGIGMKPEDAKKIFDRYYRVETNHTQHISGFGIGLYLSSEIIKRHDGEIWVESESGVGSTFYFSLSMD